MTALNLTSVEGVYWSLITLIALLALLSTLYIVGVVLGYLPDPTRLVVLAPAAVVSRERYRRGNHSDWSLSDSPSVTPSRSDPPRSL